MIYCFEDFELDEGMQVLRRLGQDVPMEPQVFDLLLLLVKNHDRLVSKDEIVDHVWNGRAISDTAISSRISSARQAIDDDGHQQRLIKTNYNKGLRFTMTPTLLSKPVYRPQISKDNPSVIVFPFRARSLDAMAEMTAESLTDEISILLSSVGGLSIVPRLAVGRRWTPDTDPVAVARGFGAQYIVTGSVRTGSNRLRVITELTNLVDNKLVWSDRFDEAMEDMFAIEDNVAKGVVGALGGKIARIESARAKRRPPESLQAWELARRAHAAAFDWRPETMAQGVSDSRKAMELDPNYAHGPVYLGVYLAWQIVQGWSDDLVLRREEAISCAALALTLSPKDAEILSAVGETYRLLGERQKAMDVYDNALARNSDIFAPWPFAIPLIGVNFAQMGQHDKALELIQVFEEKFPGNDLGKLWSRVLLGYVELCRENYEKVAELHANPPSEYNAMCRIIALTKLDRTDEAIAEFNKLKPVNPDIDLGHYIEHFKSFHVDPKIGTELSGALSKLRSRI